MEELEGKRPLSRWSLSAHNLPSSGYFHKIFGMHLQTGSVYLCTKKCLLALLYIWNYNPSPNGQIISLIGAQALLSTTPLPNPQPKYNWEMNGKRYWRFFIVEYLQPNKLKKKPNFNLIY